MLISDHAHPGSQTPRKTTWHTADAVQRVAGAVEQQGQYDQLQMRIDNFGCCGLGPVSKTSTSAADAGSLAHLNSRSLNVWVVTCDGLYQRNRQAGLHTRTPLLAPNCSCTPSQV